MFETHFEALSARYEELLLSSHQNEVILNQPLYQKTLRELSRLEPAVRDWNTYQKVLDDIAGAQELRLDPDFKEEAEREAEELAASAEAESGVGRGADGRIRSERERKKAPAGREGNEAFPSAGEALERILICGLLSLLGFAVGLGCLRMKSAEPL